MSATVTSNTSRYQWVDSVKAVCIILVFYSHCSIFYGMSIPLMRNVIEPFYVNAFFFVSGYLLLWKQLSSPKIDETRRTFMKPMGGGNLLINNVLFRIVIPSVIFSLIEFFPKKLLKGGSIGISSILYETVGGGTYWFTSALVVAEVIIVLLLLTRFQKVWFYFLSSVGFSIIGVMAVKAGSSVLPNIWFWKQGMIALLYVAAGGIYWKYERSIDMSMTRWWVLTITAVLYLYIVLFHYDSLALTTSMGTLNPAGGVVAILGSILVITVCKVLPSGRVISFIGKNSLGFYFLCGALPMICSMVCKRLPVEPNIAVLVLIWLTTLSIAYGVVAFLNRFLPWAWDLRRWKKG